MARLVIVSNRLPSPGARGARAGGLAVALQDAIRRGDLWFGWSGQVTEETAKEAELASVRGVSYATLDLGTADYERFYVGFSNAVLWPILHFRLGLMKFRREDWEGYQAVNRAFAEALKPLLKPDDLIWVHDYHLMLVARELRKLGVENRIGFFLHVPFTPPSVFAALPVARELLAGLAAYDVAGFQTRGHLQDYLDCAQRICGAQVQGADVQHGGRRSHAIAVPAGMDAAAFETLATKASASAEFRRMRESLDGRALAVSADRLDYSKGLPNRVEGYARLLARFPEHRRKVSFLQVAARSREDVEEYATLRRELDRLAGEVNGRFSEVDWLPLRYITRPMPRSTLAGLFRMARVGVVTPLRDGMNLVAKEFIAAQEPDDPGVLVLSEFAGAADALGEALIVNPHDADQIAEAMNEAYTMAAGERRRRHALLREAVFREDARHFSQTFMAALAGGNGAER